MPEKHGDLIRAGPVKIADRLHSHGNPSGKDFRIASQGETKGNPAIDDFRIAETLYGKSTRKRVLASHGHNRIPVGIRPVDDHIAFVDVTPLQIKLLQSVVFGVVVFIVDPDLGLGPGSTRIKTPVFTGFLIF